MNVDISVDRTLQNNFLIRIDEDGPWTNWDLYHLAYETEQSLLVPTFDGLQAPKHLSHFTPLPHQFEVAQNVLEQMNSKAIQADERSHGKTIK
ncbi:ATP-dependent helicase, partial [Bacillus thuringiensis]|nr:ATP-dependent helicase [Bacillus thuringiensis]